MKYHTPPTNMPHFEVKGVTLKPKLAHQFWDHPFVKFLGRIFEEQNPGSPVTLSSVFTGMCSAEFIHYYTLANL